MTLACAQVHRESDAGLHAGAVKVSLTYMQVHRETFACALAKDTYVCLRELLRHLVID